MVRVTGDDSLLYISRTKNARYTRVIFRSSIAPPLRTKGPGLQQHHSYVLNKMSIAQYGNTSLLIPRLGVCAFMGGITLSSEQALKLKGTCCFESMLPRTLNVHLGPLTGNSRYESIEFMLSSASSFAF